MGFIVQQLRYIIFFVFIVLRFPKPMSCQMQKRITSKTAADFSLRASGHCFASRAAAVLCRDLISYCLIKPLLAPGVNYK